MDIKGKTILIWGGWGLVGSAICRKLVEEKPKRLIICSLHRHEAIDAVNKLKKEFPFAPKDFFTPWWGNIFLRHSFKDIAREEIINDPKKRAMLIDDILSELTDQVLHRTTIYRLLNKYKPEIIIDCINTATAIAYQDLFQNARNALSALKGTKKKLSSHLIDSVEKLLASLYIPQLIRHVQILYRSMQENGTKIYVKIGTSGTGGMGLNIPYTHSEERPSSVLLSKSSVAGAHTMLLFLIGRTPEAPITKEIKPTAAIAWKQVGYGEIKKHGKPIQLFDCSPENTFALSGKLPLKLKNFATPLGKPLKSVFIDTGENGMFSRGEFEAITTPGQMEFVTPEEIAECAIFEIKGGNTGHDIINALDNASLSPTYRAGYLFQSAEKLIKQLEEKHNTESVAFEILGPPRLSKLLYEAYLLKLEYKDFQSVIKAKPEEISNQLFERIKKDQMLRSNIISIGIPILLPDGKSLIRGNEIKIPPFRGENEIPITPKKVDLWAYDGWVDLRKSNMKKWKIRLQNIINMVKKIPPSDSSSRFLYTREYWQDFKEIQPGKLAGWIFNYEEKGMRMKA